MTRRVLFVTWDGPQVSYLEGLFLPIFKALAERGYLFHVLQFTWGPSDRRSAIARACAEAADPLPVRNRLAKAEGTRRPCNGSPRREPGPPRGSRLGDRDRHAAQ